MSRSDHSRGYREYCGGRRDSMVEFRLEGETPQRDTRTTSSDVGGLRKRSCLRWLRDGEGDGTRHQPLKWGKMWKNKWVGRGRPPSWRGRRIRTRSEWLSDQELDLSYSDLRWHLHQRRLSQQNSWSPGRRDHQSPRRWDHQSPGRRDHRSSLECATSPRHEEGRREAASARYDNTDRCLTYDDVDKHDDSSPEYQRYWDTVIAQMEIRSEKRLEGKEELLSDISDDSLGGLLCRLSPKVKSVIMKEEALSQSPKRSEKNRTKSNSVSRTSANHTHTRGTNDFERGHLSNKTDGLETEVAHVDKKNGLSSPDRVRSLSSTDCTETVGRDDGSNSDSDSSSSNSSSSSSNTSNCHSNCSCRVTAKAGKRSQSSGGSTHMLPPDAPFTNRSFIGNEGYPSTPSNAAAPRTSHGRSRGRINTSSSSSFNQSFIAADGYPSTPRRVSPSRSSVSLATPGLESSTLSCSATDLSSSSSAMLTSSVYSSSDSGNASLLEVSPQRHDPRGFALEQLRRLTRWVLSSCVQRYMPAVRPPHVTGMQMGIQRDTDVNKWVECGVQHVVMVEREGPHVEIAKAAHHEAWQSGKCYSVDWVCRDYTREVWPHQPVDVACSHLALHTAFASPSQAELFAHNVSCCLKEGSCLVATAFSAARVLSLVRKGESGKSYESRHFKLRIHGYSARSSLPQFGVKISLQIGPDRFEDSLVQLSVLEDVFQAHRLQLLSRRSFMQVFDQTCSYGTCLQQLETLKLVAPECPGRDKLSPAMQEIADLFDVIIFRKSSSQSLR